MGVGSSSKNLASRSKSVASKAAVLAPSSSPDATQAIRVASREDHLGSLLARTAGRLESDAGAAADHDDGLAGELRLAARDDPASTVRHGATAICFRERVQRLDEDLRERRERLDRVAQHVERDARREPPASPAAATPRPPGRARTRRSGARRR